VVLLVDLLKEETNVPQDIYGFMSIILSIVFIGLSWWALQSFRFEKILKHPNGAQAKLLQIFLSIVIGYEVSRFFLDYLGWSLLFGNLFS
jgi:uncharacterized integral membrane protein (TIGR02327 family)